MLIIRKPKLIELGALIRKERLARGMELTKFGWACGLHHLSRSHLRSMLSRLERGIRCPREAILAKIIDYLGITITDTDLLKTYYYEKEIICPRCLHRHKIIIDSKFKT